MHKETINRIFEKGKVIIGKYTYEADYNEGFIKRCLTEEIGKEWFGVDGKRHDGWKIVYECNKR